MKLNSNTRISLGDENLDRALRGGLLEGQSLLLYGPPGSGKTTLAAQFIRDGLCDGEDCLFVSTEQTPEDLNRSLSHIGFDDGQEGLSVTSIHARQGKTIEGEDVVLAELEVTVVEVSRSRSTVTTSKTGSRSTPRVTVLS